MIFVTGWEATRAGGVTVDISLGADQYGTLVNWTSSAPIDAVIVKGGPNALSYVYAGESSGDTGLHTPAATPPAVPSGGVLGEQARSGVTRMRGPSGCVGRTVAVSPTAASGCRTARSPAGRG